MKRVAVTGIGAISPLGNTFSSSWDAVKNGRSGIGLITRFDASLLPWRVAGELKDFDVEAYVPAKEIKKLDPFVRYAVAAAVMAVEDAGLMKQSAVSSQQIETSPKSKVQSQKSEIKSDSSLVSRHPSLASAGVIIGSSRGGISTIEKSIGKLIAPRSSLLAPRLSPYLMPSTTISMAASYVAQKIDIKGCCLGISNACASGANAIGEAFRMIRHSYASLVLAGGTEAPLCRLCVEGYGSAGALSRNTCETPRPFDTKRDGFVLSEGACILVLEDYDHAARRGARIYGEIIGYGNTADAFHITRPDPAGEAQAIRMAMTEADINSDEIDYINTHGTATAVGDIAEAEAIRMALGEKALNIPATAIKSMTGHMLAASGAIEIAFSLMSMEEGVIPPTINIREKDPVCEMNIVAEKSHADIRTVVSNSFGFGGVNAVIVLRTDRCGGVSGEGI